jgi:hypothetical protein
VSDAGPRLLVIMGSGETSPTMVKAHRSLFERLGPGRVPAVLLDTPFGFQENADQIAAKAVEYFQESVGRDIEVAGFRSAAMGDPVEREQTLARIAAARWVFSGPGSPSYALRQWAGTPVPGLLASKLQHGGCVIFASAAALTLGVATVPVYEIYKVGEEPRWLDGLDLMADAGLNVAVIPHYDNAEGGNHDTRYCYLGERRLRVMEAQLPDDAFVLGVDEHTGCLMDLDAGTATVVGLGVVTIRRHGSSSTVPSGSSVPIASLVEMAMAGKGEPVAAQVAPSPVRPSGRSADASPLLVTIRQQEQDFDAAVAGRDVDGAVRAILELDDALVAWSRDTLQSDHMDQGKAALRRMIVKLGALAEAGAQDPRSVLGPFVTALLEERAAARAGRRFDDADRVRDRLVALGLEVRDTPNGTEWELPDPS